jgi:hypothetical protein
MATGRRGARKDGRQEQARPAVEDDNRATTGIPGVLSHDRGHRCYWPRAGVLYW